MRAPHDCIWLYLFGVGLSFCRSEKLMLLWDLNTWWRAHLQVQQLIKIAVLLPINSSAAMNMS